MFSRIVRSIGPVAKRSLRLGATSRVASLASRRLFSSSSTIATTATTTTTPKCLYSKPIITHTHTHTSTIRMYQQQRRSYSNGRQQHSSSSNSNSKTSTSSSTYMTAIGAAAGIALLAAHQLFQSAQAEENVTAVDVNENESIQHPSGLDEATARVVRYVLLSDILVLCSERV
jgi:hypothetical protein